MALFPRSSIAKKWLNGLTGLGLFVFMAIHLSENLLLLANDPMLFNGWAHFLRKFGPLLYLIEVGLLLFFLGHIFSALSVYFDKRKARPSRYAVQGNAGGASRKTASSVTMIFTGLVLLAFVVWHVLTFRFGPGIAQGYVAILDGEQVIDIHRLVVEFFSNSINVAIYVGVMVFFGFHMRHGFWSMFQSLGAHHPRYTPALYSLGVLVGLLFALGFIVIPIWVYFNPVGVALLGGAL